MIPNASAGFRPAVLILFFAQTSLAASMAAQEAIDGKLGSAFSIAQDLQNKTGLDLEALDDRGARMTRMREVYAESQKISQAEEDLQAAQYYLESEESSGGRKILFQGRDAWQAIAEARAQIYHTASERAIQAAKQFMDRGALGSAHDELEYAVRVGKGPEHWGGYKHNLGTTMALKRSPPMTSAEQSHQNLSLQALSVARRIMDMRTGGERVPLSAETKMVKEATDTATSILGELKMGEKASENVMRALKFAAPMIERFVWALNILQIPSDEIQVCGTDLCPKLPNRETRSAKTKN